MSLLLTGCATAKRDKPALNDPALADLANVAEPRGPRGVGIETVVQPYIAPIVLVPAPPEISALDYMVNAGVRVLASAAPTTLPTTAPAESTAPTTTPALRTREAAKPPTPSSQPTTRPAVAHSGPATRPAAAAPRTPAPTRSARPSEPAYVKAPPAPVMAAPHEGRPPDLVPVATWLTPDAAKNANAPRAAARRAVLQLLKESDLHPIADESGLHVPEAEAAVARQILLTDPKANDRDLIVLLLIPAGSARQSEDGVVLRQLSVPLPSVSQDAAPTTQPADAGVSAAKDAR